MFAQGLRSSAPSSLLSCMRLAEIGRPFQPEPTLWIVGWRPVPSPRLVFDVVLLDLKHCIARALMNDARVARPSLPSMDSEESHHQLSIMFCIRSCVLNRGFLGPDDGLILATVSRSGFAVWWSFVKWICDREGLCPSV